MYRRMLTVSPLILGLAAAAPLAAQSQAGVCGNRATLVDQLDKEFGEIRRGGGLASPVAIFEVFASEKTGTWTILRTGTDGQSCIMATGGDWQDDPARLTPVTNRS